MDTKELRKILEREGVNPSVYSINYPGINDVYVIKQEPLRLEDRWEGYVWVVFYTERGCEINKKSYESEDAACRDILGRILGSSTMRM